MTKTDIFISLNVKGQVVIPIALRRKLGITAKTKIRVYEEDGRIILQPITREQINRVRGMFKGAGMLEELYKDRAWERENDERRFAKWNKTARQRRRLSQTQPRSQSALAEKVKADKRDVRRGVNLQYRYGQQGG